MTKGPCRHRETWWWDEEVAEAVREKKIEFYKSSVSALGEDVCGYATNVIAF